MVQQQPNEQAQKPYCCKECNTGGYGGLSACCLFPHAQAPGNGNLGYPPI